MADSGGPIPTQLPTQIPALNRHESEAAGRSIARNSKTIRPADPTKSGISRAIVAILDEHRPHPLACNIVYRNDWRSLGQGAAGRPNPARKLQHRGNHNSMIFSGPALYSLSQYWPLDTCNSCSLRSAIALPRPSNVCYFSTPKLWRTSTFGSACTDTVSLVSGVPQPHGRAALPLPLRHIRSHSEPPLLQIHPDGMANPWMIRMALFPPA